MKREAAVAGSFYPSNPQKLNLLLQEYLHPVSKPKKAIAILAPHAGYVYSGRFAGEVYSRVAIPDVAVVLCPNHTGAGKRIAVDSEGSWETPLGEVKIHTVLAEKILHNCFGAVSDKVAHRQEHAVEVQVPFLQKLNPKFKIVPIVLGPLNLEACHSIGRGLAKAIETLGETVLIVASSDMSHYISATDATKLDKLALHCVEKLDADGLYRTVVDYDISMCGFIPATVAIEAAKLLGAERCEIIAYGNSGDASGDYSRVVAYASAMIY